MIPATRRVIVLGTPRDELLQENDQILRLVQIKRHAYGLAIRDFFKDQRIRFVAGVSATSNF